MTDDCVDLKNIKYQTMLLNGNSKIDSDKQDTPDLSVLLSQENTKNKLKPWSKLGETEQYKKIEKYIGIFKPKIRQSQLKLFLFKNLKNKKLQRTKDVIYDSEKGIIKSIPGLKFNTSKKKFTLKRVDKKNSTLKGLPMKHRQKTHKNKIKDTGMKKNIGRKKVKKEKVKKEKAKKEKVKKEKVKKEK